MTSERERIAEEMEQDADILQFGPNKTPGRTRAAASVREWAARILSGEFAPQPPQADEGRRVLGHACVNPEHDHVLRNDIGCQWQPVYEDSPQADSEEAVTLLCKHCGHEEREHHLHHGGCRACPPKDRCRYFSPAPKHCESCPTAGGMVWPCKGVTSAKHPTVSDTDSAEDPAPHGWACGHGCRYYYPQKEAATWDRVPGCPASGGSGDHGHLIPLVPLSRLEQVRRERDKWKAHHADVVRRKREGERVHAALRDKLAARMKPPRRKCDHMVDPRDKFCAGCWLQANPEEE